MVAALAAVGVMSIVGCGKKDVKPAETTTAAETTMAFEDIPAVPDETEDMTESVDETIEGETMDADAENAEDTDVDENAIVETDDMTDAEDKSDWSENTLTDAEKSETADKTEDIEKQSDDKTDKEAENAEIDVDKTIEKK